jgi:hypothetical protein
MILPPLTSKFRHGFWIRLFIDVVGGFSVVLTLIYLMIKHDWIDIHDGWFWITLLATLFFISSVLQIIFKGLKKLIIYEREIVIKYLLTGKVEVISCDKILGFATRRRRHKRGVRLSDGYFEFQIKLADDESLVFSANEYENYSELTGKLYRITR